MKKLRLAAVAVALVSLASIALVPGLLEAAASALTLAAVLILVGSLITLGQRVIAARRELEP